jgi:hypothetical protein
MAEQESNVKSTSAPATKPRVEDENDFADEEEAMASMGW